MKTHEKVKEKTVFLRCVKDALPLFVCTGIRYHFTEQGHVKPEYQCECRQQDEYDKQQDVVRKRRIIEVNAGISFKISAVH
jgi:hypothetical protein